MKEAVNILLEVIQSLPNDALAYMELASIYKDMGNHQKAISLVEIVRPLLDANKEDDQYWYNMACMEAITDNVDLALDYLEKSKEAGNLDAS